MNTKLKVCPACVLSTAVSPGPHTSDKETAWRTSTSAVFVGSCRAIPGRKRSQTPKCWDRRFRMIFQQHLRCLEHARCMDDGLRILKDLLYSELATGHHPTGRPMLQFKDHCKRDMKLIVIDPLTHSPSSWELIATNCGCCRHRRCSQGSQKG